MKIKKKTASPIHECTSDGSAVFWANGQCCPMAGEHLQFTPLYEIKRKRGPALARGERQYRQQRNK